MKNFILILSAIILSSCGVSRTPVVVSLTQNSTPDIGAKNNVELGETLITTEFGYKTKALRLNNAVKPVGYSINVEFKANDLFINKYNTKDYELYKRVDSDLKSDTGIAIPKGGGQAQMYIGSMGAQLFKTKEPINYIESFVSVPEKQYFKQQFIYNGKANNSLKFVYREFVDDTARPAFSQDLQYDLNDGSVIGFKGLRIEVIKATNTYIEYIVKSNFTKV